MWVVTLLILHAGVAMCEPVPGLAYLHDGIYVPTFINNPVPKIQQTYNSGIHQRCNPLLIYGVTTTVLLCHSFLFASPPGQCP